MTEFKFERREENVKDYIKTALVSGNIFSKILLAALAVCLLAVAVSGVIAAVYMSRPSMLIITACAVTIGAFYPVFTSLFIKSTTKKLTSESDETNGITIGVCEENILIIKNGKAAGKMEWSDVTEIIEGKTGFFVIEKEGSLLILGKNSVSSGTYDEAGHILRAKKEALKANG